MSPSGSVEGTCSSDGSTPRRNTPRSSRTKVSRAVYHGGLLYRAATESISDEQKEFLCYHQEKLNEAELQKALLVMSQLLRSPRSLARANGSWLPAWVPTLHTKLKLREQRRIGVGYRDKGSLRPRHKPSLPGRTTLGYSELVALFGESKVPDQIRPTPDEVLGTGSKLSVASIQSLEIFESGIRIMSSHGSVITLYRP